MLQDIKLLFQSTVSSLLSKENSHVHSVETLNNPINQPIKDLHPNNSNLSILHQEIIQTKDITQDTKTNNKMNSVDSSNRLIKDHLSHIEEDIIQIIKGIDLMINNKLHLNQILINLDHKEINIRVLHLNKMFIRVIINNNNIKGMFSIKVIINNNNINNIDLLFNNINNNLIIRGFLIKLLLLIILVMEEDEVVEEEDVEEVEEVQDVVEV